MPHVCPNCGSDYGKRFNRLSPVRSFRTGLNKLTQVLAKQLFRSLEQEQRKLVAFSDSREAAAVLANGVESAHWIDVLDLEGGTFDGAEPSAFVLRSAVFW